MWNWVSILYTPFQNSTTRISIVQNMIGICLSTDIGEIGLQEFKSDVAARGFEIGSHVRYTKVYPSISEAVLVWKLKLLSVYCATITKHIYPGDVIMYNGQWGQLSRDFLIFYYYINLLMFYLLYLATIGPQGCTLYSVHPKNI